jgi:conjugal transfer ATP-binding protein TraC
MSLNLFNKHKAKEAAIEEAIPEEMQAMLDRHKDETPPNDSGDRKKSALRKAKEKAKAKALKIKERLISTSDKLKNYGYQRRLKRAYKKLGVKTSRFIQEQNTFDSLPSDRLVSLTEREWNRLWKRNRLGDYLPYWIYDEKSGVYANNDNTFGVIYEICPRNHMDGKVAATIDEIVSKLPEDIILQIVLIGGGNNHWRLLHWRETHLKRVYENASNSDLLAAAVNNIRDFMLRKHREAISDSMQASVKNCRVFLSIRSENHKELTETAATLRNALSSNNFYPEICHPDILKPVLYELLNGDVEPSEIPRYTPYKEINRQLIGGETEIAFFGDYLRVSAKVNRRLDKEAKGKYWTALAPQSLPEQAHIFEFGSKIGDKISAALNSAQFNDNYIISATIAKQPPNRTKQIKRNHRFNLKSGFPSSIFRRLANVRKEGVDILDRIDERKEAIYSYDLDVLVSGDSYDKMEKNVASIKSYWSKGGKDSSIKLEKIPDVNQLAFLAALPMGASKEYIDTCAKSFSLFSEQLAQFIPVEADYSGNGVDNMLFLTRRAVLCGIDMFISNSNFNGYVVAQPGSGKSVLLQYIAFCSYARGDRVFVMDIGGSQKRLCEALEGQYLEIDPNAPISFNPFSSIGDDKALSENLTFLTNFCYMLGSNKNVVRAEEDERYIKSYLGDAIKACYAEKGRKTEITDIRLFVAKEDDKRCKDFARQMSVYCKGGIYEKFFTGESQIDFGGDFIVGELQLIENDADIRDPIITMLLYHLEKSVYIDRNVATRKKLVAMIDEAHKFLGKNPIMDDFIEQAYRRFRKENGSMIIATQSFEDIYSDGRLSKVGSAIVSSGAWKFFLGQSETSINLLIQSGAFSFSEYEEKMLRSIATKKGEYSEIFLITADNLKVPVRLVVPRFFYYITTSDPLDKKKINDIALQEQVSVVEAIEILIKRESAAKAK